MKRTIILGVALIIVGAAVLGYGRFTYKTQKTVLQVGPIKATAERTKSVPLPPIIGWALAGSAVCVLVFGSRRSRA